MRFVHRRLGAFDAHLYLTIQTVLTAHIIRVYVAHRQVIAADVINKRRAKLDDVMAAADEIVMLFATFLTKRFITLTAAPFDLVLAAVLTFRALADVTAVGCQ